MLKVNFGRYTYFDPNADIHDKVEPYNSDKFNKYIADRDYLGAADYASKYHFPDDPEKDKALRNYIINLRREGRVLGALYGRITDPDDLAAVSFADNVFLKDGTSRVDTGKYGETFRQIKESLGSSEQGNDATNLSVTFHPKKRTLFGIDALMADNDFNIDNFYAESGLTEQDLVENGVIVNHTIDGKTVLKFHKTNDLANKILYHIPRKHRYGDLPVFDSNINPNVEGFDDSDNKVGTASSGQIRSFRDVIDNANEIKQKYLADFNNNEKQYSSTTAPWISDELYQLQQMGLTDEEYNRRAKIVAPQIFNAINDLTSEYEMYSDKYNDDPRNSTLVPMDDHQKSDLADLIASTAPKDIQVDAMISNGKIGALITIAGSKDSKTGELKTRPYKIFVPKLLQEEAQKRINADSSYRAVQEANTMLDLRYEYKLQDGRSLAVNNDGDFAIDNKVISRDEAIRTLDRDMIIEEASADLKYRYMNSNGTVFDSDGYEAKAREVTLNSIHELYPDMNVTVNPSTLDISIIDQYGETHSASDLFNKKIDRENTQYEVYNRLKDIIGIYDSLMNDLLKYLKL